MLRKLARAFLLLTGIIFLAIAFFSGIIVIAADIEALGRLAFILITAVAALCGFTALDMRDAIRRK